MAITPPDVLNLFMSALSVRLPGSLHRPLKQLAQKEGVSVNQLIPAAVAEKLSALMTEDELPGRAARRERGHFEAALALVPDAEPALGDQLRQSKVIRHLDVMFADLLGPRTALAQNPSCRLLQSKDRRRGLSRSSR